MKTFVVGQEYALREIMDQLGGEMMSFLPRKDGRIVCGRFRQAPFNPNAPYEILVGNLPKVRAHLDMLLAQGGTIPVFVKEGANRWRFHGPMAVDRYETKPEIVKRAAGASERKEGVHGVLHLRDASKRS